MIKKLIPQKLKKIIQSTHIYSFIDAKRLAKKSKRLDICAAQFAHILHLMKSEGIQGKTCLELGSGWVLSHALICYLLGARKIITTDVAANAQPKNLSIAINHSITSLIRDILSPFEAHELLRERLNQLQKIKCFDFKTLESLGIYYQAPIDLAKTPLKEKVDFIYSMSVLEHVPVDDIEPLLKNLHTTLNNNGVQAHCIHLEDHKDTQNDPFAFLSIPNKKFDRKQQTERGNRIRANDWLKKFSAITATQTSILYSWKRTDIAPPSTIDPSIIFFDNKELTTTHLGIFNKKHANS